jgi:O-succinylbenzoate synthase
VRQPGLVNVLNSARYFRVALRGSFRGVNQREGVLIHGPRGWGEFAPFADYSDERAGRWLSAAIEAAFVGWPEPRRTRVRVNGIVPVRSIGQTRDLTRQIVQNLGCRTVKVKVADLAEDPLAEVSRVAAIRGVLDEVLGAGQGRIRLDANAGWTVDEALRRLERLAEFDIEYVEQPCRSAAELKQVKSEGLLPVAADEAIRVDGLVDSVAEFADVAVLKAAPLGGVAAGLQIAERIGIPAVVSGSMDTSVGLGSGIALAGALPECSYDCGLATGTLLAQDLSASTTLPFGGMLPVAATPPDEHQLTEAELRLPRQQRVDWQERLARAWEFVPVGLADYVSGQ